MSITSANESLKWENLLQKFTGRERLNEVEQAVERNEENWDCRSLPVN